MPCNPRKYRLYCTLLPFYTFRLSVINPGTFIDNLRERAKPFATVIFISINSGDACPASTALITSILLTPRALHISLIPPDTPAEGVVLAIVTVGTLTGSD